MNEMDLSELFGGALAHAKEEHAKHIAAETREIGCVPLGPMVGRLIKKWPSPALVEAGDLDTDLMDGEGALPELCLYRPGKQNMVVIRGRESLDALADLLAAGGYGKARRTPAPVPEEGR